MCSEALGVVLGAKQLLSLKLLLVHRGCNRNPFFIQKKTTLLPSKKKINMSPVQELFSETAGDCGLLSSKYLATHSMGFSGFSFATAVSAAINVLFNSD